MIRFLVQNLTNFFAGFYLLPIVES